MPKYPHSIQTHNMSATIARSFRYEIHIETRIFVQKLADLQYSPPKVGCSNKNWWPPRMTYRSRNALIVKPARWSILNWFQLSIMNFRASNATTPVSRVPPRFHAPFHTGILEGTFGRKTWPAGGWACVTISARYSPPLFCWYSARHSVPRLVSNAVVCKTWGLEARAYQLDC